MTPFEDLRNIDAWVVDVDGCLVNTDQAGGAGGVPIDGAVEFLRTLRGGGHAVRVVTNASQRPPRAYAEHLRHLGLDIPDEDFMTAGSAAAAYLATMYPGGRVLAIAEDGIIDPLRALDVDVTSDDWTDVVAVVVGGVSSLPMEQLNAACHAVADNGAALYVTVDVPWFHGGRGRSVCTSAAVAHAIAWVTGVEPVVLGKPSDALAETLRHELGGEAARIAVVGDASAEIELAREMGALSIAVLTGALTRNDIDIATAAAGRSIPDLVVESVAALTPYVRAQPTGPGVATSSTDSVSPRV